MFESRHSDYKKVRIYGLFCFIRKDIGERMMHIAVCDDEEIFLERMSEMLKQIPEIESVACYNNI